MVKLMECVIDAVTLENYNSQNIVIQKTKSLESDRLQFKEKKDKL